MSETVIKKTLCGICSSKCPMECRIKDDKVIGVESGADIFGNYGGLCPKGAAAVQFLYNKERIRYPLLRCGERGSGKFRRISWDEALDIIDEKLSKIKEAYGPESVVFYAGIPKWYRPALMRFANAFGSPNYCTESSTCFQAYALSWRLTFGNQPCMPDLKNCRTLMLWSRNLFHSDIHMGPSYRELQERGVKIIAVDPKHTVTAHEAELYLDPYPGTDGALALAMANVILSEGLEDREFIKKYVHGFEAFREYVKSFPPEKAESITGVDKEKIIKAARLYAVCKPSAIMFSASPVVHNINGVQNYRAVEALIAITGNYDVPGGNCPKPGPAVSLNEFGKVLRRKDREAIGEKDFPVWFELSCEEAQCTKLAQYIEKGEPYPIKAVFGMGLNHRMWPKPSHLLKALGSLDFYVNAELFMSDSSLPADLILPAGTFFERDEVLQQPGGRVRLREHVIEPYGETRNDVEIIQEIMKKMGLYDEVLSGSYEDYMNYILKPSGLDISTLKGKEEDVKAPNVLLPETRSFERQPFMTPSGKIELYSEVLKKYESSYGYHSLPYYIDYREQRKKEEARKYPLILNTGSRKPQFFHARTYRMPWICGLEPVTMVEMRPENAEERGLKDGDRVRVSSPAGEITGILSTNLSCHRDVVNICHGNKNGDANELIAEDYLDPISGFPGFKSYFCEVEKTDEV